MPPTIYEELKEIAQMLHFFGQHERANRLITLAVTLQEMGVERVEDLKKGM